LHVPHETEPQPVRQAGALLVLGGVSRRGIGELVVVTGERAQPDERDRERAPTSAGRLRGDEDVHVRVGPVAHPVHERHLAAEIIEIAAATRRAVEEQVDHVRRGRRVLTGRREGAHRTHPEAESEREAEPLHSHLPSLGMPCTVRPGQGSDRWLHDGRSRPPVPS
jgi:hypothetical protein